MNREQRIEYRIEQLDEQMISLQQHKEYAPEEIQTLIDAEIQGKRTEYNYLQDNYLGE